MQNNQRLGGWPLRGTGGLILALSAVVLIAGGGAAWWSWTQLASNPDESTPAQVDGAESSSASNSEPTDGSVAIAPTMTTPVTVYWLDATETGLELVPMTIDAEVNAETAEEPTTILTAAFDQLLQGNVANSAEDGSLAFSELPTATDLLALTVEGDGVHVDLSGAFSKGGGVPR